LGHVDQADRDDERLKPRPEDDRDRNREDHGREGKRDVGRPHEHGVEPPARVARDDPDGGSDGRPERDGEQRDPHRSARAVKHAGQDVAAELIRPEQVRAARRRSPERQMLREGIDAAAEERRCETPDRRGDDERGADRRPDEAERRAHLSHDRPDARLP